MKQAVYAIVLLLFVFSVGAWGQSREQLKGQAEAQLRQLSPEEIQAKLKEYGISLDEAKRRAAEVNISLDEYLAKASTTSPAAPPSGATQSADEVKAVFPSFGTTPAGHPQPTAQAVPGFEGRVAGDLHPFGYDIFRLAPSTFEPVLNVPTPTSYELGPGDELSVSVWGETKLSYQLVVNREGNAIVPEVGPVSANGLSIQQFRDKLLRRMTAVYSGLKNGEPSANTFLDVSLGKLRTIQIYVLGEVTNPGGYALSSMATAFQALYLAGGPSVRGSMRSIDIMRNGKAISSVDFYDVLLRGDRSKDPRLQDGDLVMVKPAGKRAAISGRVLRPAIYELRDADTFSDLLKISGGLQVQAYTDRVHIERIIPFNQRTSKERTIQDLDLTFANVEAMQRSPYLMQDGDVVTVYDIVALPQRRVTVSGNVNKPGRLEWREGMRVAEAIMRADSLQRNTFSERGTVIRLLSNLRKEIINFNPRLALAGDPTANIELRNEDEVTLYKESQFFPEHTVTIWGAVRNPGTYPRNEKMSVSDLIVMAGGLREEAMLTGWELARMDTTKVGVYSTVKTISVDREYWTDSLGGATLLGDYDGVNVPSDPRYTMPRSVVISGYVQYPGTYAIRARGERVSDIVKRAGGLRPEAYLEGSRFSRSSNNAGQIPVDFKEALSDPESAANIEVSDGDAIQIAQREDVVYVRGEVFTPMAVLYQKGGSLSHYLQQAGGTKESADDDRVYVILPNGSKWKEGWFIFPDDEILPGSTVYVPTKKEKEDNSLAILRDWATIALSIATLAVAIVQVTK